MHGHFHAKHAVQAAEKAGAGHVHEWNSARSVACQSLQSRISARRAGMCAKRTEQRVDVRALAAAAARSPATDDCPGAPWAAAASCSAEGMVTAAAVTAVALPLACAGALVP